MCDMEADLEDIRKQYAPERGDFRDEMTQLRGLEEGALQIGRKPRARA